MKIKTSEATGKALDWGLAQALELNPEISRPSPYDGSIAVLALPLPEGYPRHHKCGFFHADPAVCMANIASYKIDVRHQFYSSPELSVLACWGDEGEGGYVSAYGYTPEQAVARCVIAMKLGDEFEVPDELGVMS